MITGAPAQIVALFINRLHLKFKSRNGQKKHQKVVVYTHHNDSMTSAHNTILWWPWSVIHPRYLTLASGEFDPR